MRTLRLTNYWLRNHSQALMYLAVGCITKEQTCIERLRANYKAVVTVVVQEESGRGSPSLTLSPNRNDSRLKDPRSKISCISRALAAHLRFPFS